MCKTVHGCPNGYKREEETVTPEYEVFYRKCKSSALESKAKLLCWWNHERPYLADGKRKL